MKILIGSSKFNDNRMNKHFSLTHSLPHRNTAILPAEPATFYKNWFWTYHSCQFSNRLQPQWWRNQDLIPIMGKRFFSSPPSHSSNKFPVVQCPHVFMVWCLINYRHIQLYPSHLKQKWNRPSENNQFLYISRVSSFNKLHYSAFEQHLYQKMSFTYTVRIVIYLAILSSACSNHGQIAKWMP
jgi:hypothetical protein